MPNALLWLIVGCVCVYGWIAPVRSGGRAKTPAAGGTHVPLREATGRALGSVPVAGVAPMPNVGHVSSVTNGTEAVRPVTVHRSVRGSVVPGCSPMLTRHEDGSLSFRGCLTHACGENNQCQGATVGFPGGEQVTCECMDPVQGAVLCQGWVVFDEVGEIVGTFCFKADCEQACTMWLPGGVGGFHLCDC